MSRLFTIGEALIDFIPTKKGLGLKDVTFFKKSPGGAPANVASAVAKLGGDSAFIGKVGADPFGDFLVDTLNGIGVDTRYMTRTSKTNTTLAFVSLKQDGNREFLFYRNPGADMLLDEDEIDGNWFCRDDILHFCSVGLVEAPAKYAHIKAIELLKAKKGLISFDPNVRLPLWDDNEKCRDTIREFIPLANIIKVSDEEIGFITGISDEKEAISSLFIGDVELVVYTKGAKGAALYTKNFMITIPGEEVEVVDTTGAGDAFIGAFLYKILHEGIEIEKLDKFQAYDMLKFANKVASISVTRLGVISSLPTKDEIDE
ncbi:MAG: carbohydrate kinase [Caldicoprobacterales bacterium]